MSIKGLTKGITRTPQQFKQKFNIGDITKDAIFIDAERRFDDLEKETKKLHDESKKYFEAINGTPSCYPRHHDKLTGLQECSTTRLNSPKA